MVRSIVPAVVIAAAVGLISWDRPAAARQDAGFPKGVSAAIDNCRACHSGADAIGARGFVGRFKSNEFILLDETKTWDAHDPHSRAYDVLTSDLGKQMKENLGYAVENDTRCLTCHATDVKPDAKPKTPTDFHKADGVSCVACHGIQEAWQSRHWKEPRDGDAIEWRTLSPKEKADAGMTDLRNPAVRGQLCASCHVGSAKEGKVVTHEMYAAGHPPLPPFELATFQKGQPPHWAHPTDTRLKFFHDDTQGMAIKKNANWRWELFRFHAGEVSAARDVVSGAIASLLAEARQIQGDAEGHETPEWEGVDFARFDCYACHHDLKVPSARQERGYA
ncbi:MAG TPA: multiheme c-type cytochrome, partial [Gemmataceae bacterium]|nr:multiheme c-type cytochrome [Gemmataceae bacterium]